MGSKVMATTTKGMNSRKRIIDTAFSLFGQKGYQPTCVSDICQVAGIATGTFYHYFKAKQDILTAFIDQENQGIEAYFQSLHEATQTENILKVVAYKIQIYDSKGQELVSDLYSSALMTKADILNVYEYPFTHAMEESYRKGRAAGEFVDTVEPARFSDLAACIFFFTALTWSFQPQKITLYETLYPKFIEFLGLYKVK
jgi:AcrR family transcriptional regulator